MLVLGYDSCIRPEAVGPLGKENKALIAKMALLNEKDTVKAYGSIVTYVIMGSDAVWTTTETIPSHRRRVSPHECL